MKGLQHVPISKYFNVARIVGSQAICFAFYFSLYIALTGGLIHRQFIYSFFLNLRGQSWRKGTNCDCKATGCRFGPHLRKLNIYVNLYFHFLRSGVEVKRGFDFRHSTRNAFRIQQKVGIGES